MPPLKTPIGRPGSSVFLSYRQLLSKVWFSLLSPPEKQTVLSLIVSCLGMFRNHRMKRGRTQQRAPLLRIEHVGPRGEYLWCFSSGEMTLRNVDRQHMHSTAVFTTTLPNGCIFSYFLPQQWLVYANLTGSLAHFSVVYHLCFLRSTCYLFGQCDPFLQNTILVNSGSHCTCTSYVS